MVPIDELSFRTIFERSKSCGFLLFALAYWRAYCIGILFELATAPYISSILLSPQGKRSIALPILGSGILDHTLLMADATHNKKKTQRKKIHIETIAYDNHHDQTYNPFPLRISSFLTRRRFSSLSGGSLKRTSILDYTHVTSLNVHTLSAASNSPSMHTCSLPFPYFLIHRLNPPRHNTIFAFGLSREHTVCVLLGCIWDFALR